VVDMAEEMPGDYMKLFLSCDNHWNELGNLQAARIIAAQFRSLVDGPRKRARSVSPNR
jgi:hypothetical protein